MHYPKKWYTDIGVKSMAYSESQKKATMKYLENNMEQIRFWMPKGSKDTIKAYAKSKGMSMAEYLKGLIEKDMKSGL